MTASAAGDLISPKGRENVRGEAYVHLSTSRMTRGSNLLGTLMVERGATLSAGRPGWPGHDGAESRPLMTLTRETVFACSGSSLIVAITPGIPVAVCLEPPNAVTPWMVDHAVVSWMTR